MVAGEGAMEDVGPAERRKRRTRAAAHGLLRDLHLYLGLFVSPLILVFAVSAVGLAIGGLSRSEGAGAVERRTVRLVQPLGDDAFALAKTVRAELGLPGEIGFVRLRPAEGELAFPLDRPGERTQVSVDLRSGAAVITRGQTGLWDALVYLHKKPGPHNVKLRGNWAPMGVWAWLADASVYLLLFATLSGVYLWLVLRSERRTGLLLLGLGAASFAAAVTVLVA